MLSYKAAFENILESVSLIKLETEEILLTDSIDRILAEDIISDVNLPRFTNSAMDGYAVLFNPKIRSWKIIAEIPAGKFAPVQMDSHSAVRIMTGAMLPDGCDTVIPVENCVQSGDSLTISENYKLKKNENTRLTGEDLNINTLALKEGAIIKINNVNLAAACGKSKVKVFKKLNIGILASGDELIPAEQKPFDDKIRSTNVPSLIASIKEMKMNPVDFGICEDKTDMLTQKLKQCLNSQIDILITTGGVSVGKYDFMQHAINSAGAEIKFWKVNIKPGKPLLFSIYKTRHKIIPIFSLPGNPVSCYVNFKLFVKNVLLRNYGVEEEKSFLAKLKSDTKKHDNRLHFVMAMSNFDFESKRFEVESSGSQSSGTMSTMSNSNCMFLFPEKLNLLKKGEWVECMRL